MDNIGDTVVASISEVKAGLSRIVDEPQPTVVLRGSKPVAAVMPMDQFNEYIALKKLVSHPEIFEQLIAEARAAAKTPLKQLKSMDDLDELAAKVAREEAGRP